METIITAGKTLMKIEPFYGLFLLMINKRFSDTAQTAQVEFNGLDIELAINKKWWYSLSPLHRVGVIKHELLHICLFHFDILHEILKNEPHAERKIINYAGDIVVNQMINQNFIYPNAVVIDDFSTLNLVKNKGLYYYYEKLKGHIPPSFTKLVVNHGKWSDITDALKPILKKQIIIKMEQTANDVKKARGILPIEIETQLNYIRQERVLLFDWRKFFRRFVGYNYEIETTILSKKKESKRFDDACGVKIKKKHKILVAVDVSGSVSHKELNEFFTEINYLFTHVKVTFDIIECDADIQALYTFKGNPPENIHGRGGTCFSPVIKYYNENRDKYSMLVYFTDGYGEKHILKPFKRVIWVISSNGNSNKDYYPGYMLQIQNIIKK